MLSLARSYIGVERCISLFGKQLAMTSMSISLPKHQNASSRVWTMGSPRTLKLVLRTAGDRLKAREQRVLFLVPGGMDRLINRRARL